MARQFNADTREFDDVPAGWELQHNAESKRWDYAPPGSVPRFLDDRQEWVLAPPSWVLQEDAASGHRRYGPPPASALAAAPEQGSPSPDERPRSAQGLQGGNEGEPDPGQP